MSERGPGKIGKGKVDAAIASAHKTLADDLPWIRKSALLERAYFFGVWAGLREMAKEDDLKGFMVRTFVDTAYSRGLDNTFASTEMGKAFNALERSLKTQTGEEAPSITEAVEHLTRAVARHEDLFRQAIPAIRELSADLQAGVRRCASLKIDDPTYRHAVEQRFEMLRELEHWVRIVSLLETDHDRWKDPEP